MFGRKEVNHLLISALILGFVFGFDDGKETFNLFFWLFNFLVVAVIAGLSIFGREFVKKVVAKRKNCVAEYEIWWIKRFGFGRGAKFERVGLKRGIPLFSVIAVLISFVSLGRVFFCAVGKTDVTSVKAHRVGRKFIDVTNYEEAVILFSGIVFNLLMALIFNMINIYPLNLFFIVNMWLVVFNMLPIPPLDGGKIFFNSILIYIFGLAFIVLGFGLKDLNIIFNIILSVLIAFVLLVIFYYFGEYKK